MATFCMIFGVEVEFVFYPLRFKYVVELIVETAQSVDVDSPLSRSVEFRQRAGPVFEPRQVFLLTETLNVSV